MNYGKKNTEYLRIVKYVAKKSLQTVHTTTILTEMLFAIVAVMIMWTSILERKQRLSKGDFFMIKARKGKVKFKGNLQEIVAEYMCLTLSMIASVITPVHGKENARTELYKMIDEVLDVFDEREEENCHKN